MNFCSDNATGVSPEILAAIAGANCGAVMSYGDDEYTQRLQVKFSDLFETSVTVFPVATGSAANALALAVMTPPYGAVYCHAESHINVDECGAPEFFTGGAKLVTVIGNHAKIEAETLEKMLDRAGAGVVHHVQPAAVSITQATEAAHSTTQQKFPTFPKWFALTICTCTWMEPALPMLLSVWAVLRRMSLGAPVLIFYRLERQKTARWVRKLWYFSIEN